MGALVAGEAIVNIEEATVHEVFLTYRRADSGGDARNLRRDLDVAFGRDTVLLDITGLKKGLDFRKTIDEGLANCKVLLALIGPSWAEAKDEAGRRLAKDNDLVRLEIVAALARDIPVIPVLVGGASMPAADQLPNDLKDLVFRDGVELTHARWDSDVQLLINALGSYLKPRSKIGNGPSILKGLITLAVVALLCGGGWYAYQLRGEIQARDAEIAAQREADAKRDAERAAEEEAKHQAEIKAAALAKSQADARQAEAEAAQLEERRRAEQTAEYASRAAAANRAAKEAAASARADWISSVAVTRYGPTGARFEAAYAIADHSPLRTGIRICITQGGQQVQGTPCAIVSLKPDLDKVTVDMSFTDSTAMVIKRNGQAVVESCLVSYGDNVKTQAVISGTCRTQPW